MKIKLSVPNNEVDIRAAYDGEKIVLVIRQERGDRSVFHIPVIKQKFVPNKSDEPATEEE